MSFQDCCWYGLYASPAIQVVDLGDGLPHAVALFSVFGVVPHIGNLPLR
jgi:hypothetical protein